mmetsp:Transcript_21/g.48  ORF Transcript_21/g.48 Transcript_21/m.48 type:complete len:151 (-) Transcript_21:344-796(-)
MTSELDIFFASLVTAIAVKRVREMTKHNAIPINEAVTWFKKEQVLLFQQLKPFKHGWKNCSKIDHGVLKLAFKLSRSMIKKKTSSATLKKKKEKQTFTTIQSCILSQFQGPLSINNMFDKLPARKFKKKTNQQTTKSTFQTKSFANEPER